ncbi:hypothetical protein [Granulicella sibirica]|uniref:Uncharacterized protein n=1 Tax=Granulicella sibirica TaxID=2479048 RepID=A0A4Q0SX82_9BACT|nr:hypothetical protein [Granulicella sibirica]RXH55735.1 hypothetical protein GRAN_2592 [Granulicella sibirica]
MTFCLHAFPAVDPPPPRSRPFAWMRFAPCQSFLLRLVESHLANVQRVRGLLEKLPAYPRHQVQDLWFVEDPASDLVLRYGIEPDTPVQYFIRVEDQLDDFQALHLVASAPIAELCASIPRVPPPPPGFTPLAVIILRKRLAMEASNADGKDPNGQSVVHISHTTPHILPSLSNREVGAFAQSHTLKSRCHPDIQRRVTTKP